MSSFMELVVVEPVEHFVMNLVVEPVVELILLAL